MLPPLVDRLAFDLHLDGAAIANAVAESVRTLERIGKTGRTQSGARVSFGTQHACRDDVREFRLNEAADSLVKASTPQPWSTSKTSNWVARAGGLPDYIQHVSHGIKRSDPSMSTSEAIAKAIGVVKRWAAGGGKVDKNTQAAAAKAIAEWEKLKADNKAKHAVKEAALRKAVTRLLFVVGEVPDQATFAKRYASRVGVMEGLMRPVESGNVRAVETAAKTFGLDGSDVADVREAVVAERALARTLMEALGYGSTPIRAAHGKNKGKFHGMHGMERAVRKKTSIKGSGAVMVVCPSCNANTLAGASCAKCGSDATVAMGSGGSLVEAGAAAPVAAPVASPVFEGLHPRAAHGEFGSKGGAKPAASGSGTAGAGASQAGALVSALQASDPQYKEAQAMQGQIDAAAARAGSSVPSAQSAQLAGQELQAIGYGNDAGGIAQFQRENGMPVTGQLDTATLQTVQTVYSQNASGAASRIPDFTGLPGSGVKVSARRSGSAPGRSTLGKTAQKSIRLAADQEPPAGMVHGLVEADGYTFATTYPFPPTGTNHASSGPEGGLGTRQPGDDDMDFDELFGGTPPNLRPGVGTSVCATCVHFAPGAFLGKGGCMAYSAQVDRLEVCDSYLTLTPPDATLRVFEAQLEEALRTGEGDAIVRARAGLRVARGKVEGGVGMPHPADECLAEALAWECFTRAQLDIEERSFSPEERRALAKKGKALSSGAFPISSEKDLANAVQAWGRSDDADKPALKRLMVKMAKKLGVGQGMLDRINALAVAA